MQRIVSTILIQAYQAGKAAGWLASRQVSGIIRDRFGLSRTGDAEGTRLDKLALSAWMAGLQDKWAEWIPAAQRPSAEDVERARRLANSDTSPTPFALLRARLSVLGKATFGDGFTFETDDRADGDPTVTIDQTVEIAVQNYDDTDGPVFYWGVVWSTPGTYTHPPDGGFEQMGECRGVGHLLDTMLQDVLKQVVAVRCQKRIDTDAEPTGTSDAEL